MAKEESEDVVDILRERGLTCGKLRNLEKREIREASDFRRIGFNQIAQSQEASAKKIKELRNKICRLR